MKMTRKIFNDTMRDLWSEPLKTAPLSVTFLREAWDTYNDTLMTLDSGKQIDVMLLEALPDMDTEKRLRWRTSLAEQGFEMTPIQVDQYISIIELALGI
jgi:hypothetical protein|tara:strand:- start:740 stop:1036 length:297 start_codon:yes stop_codon:yes gene_type:complete